MTTIMLLLPRPQALMLGYLLGALLTSITLGLVIVFSLHGSGAVNTTRNTLSPAADIALGAIALVVSLVLFTERDAPLRERRRQRKSDRGPKKPPRWQQALSKGSPRATFVVGMLLTLPGASYLGALHGISGLDYSTVATVLLVLMVNVIMMALLEVPSIGFFVAPDWTPAAVERAKDWFSRNARKAAVIGAAGVGTLLIVRGLITLLR